MASSMSLKLAYVVVLCLVVGAPLAHGAINYGQVTSSLEPSIPYLTSGGDVQPGSCSRIKSLDAAAQTTPDLQVACNYLKSAAGRCVALIRIRGRG
ncbi:ARABIDOPSIS THALIANA LIPID TRANSFER PROTEIN 1, lipid transfer protein 1, LIPID TRANSFER PROTEIN 1 [Hibiscus trionum]|uniref:ARABIDOPSIS THALIANA LIPID TRANSFER PROTEIN 1, lipid transfer protein 1, LIPID TRANSFER PROTEIN 1 n=1 Tax=Hibiscus trionum TaxID=183268 RepID=A0A9W7MQ19_HIBTR|nr:ARABIDOPSIS THALIANA LIPID TRANSFER PROTEIN 1, lipid transfer protein 1, LIPID TRANSFER PROTEIN 1 [Hibiscus trionum]